MEQYVLGYTVGIGTSGMEELCIITDGDSVVMSFPGLPEPRKLAEKICKMLNEGSI